MHYSMVTMVQTVTDHLVATSTKQGRLRVKWSATEAGLLSDSGQSARALVDGWDY